MNNILKETRLESYLQTETNNRKKLILSALNCPKTARQIARDLGFQDLNSVKPRLCELVKEGRIEVIDKTLDESTNRKVAIYRKIG